MKENVLMTLLALILSTLIALSLYWLIVGKTEAKVLSCKHENAECNINESGKRCCPGLLCVDKDGVPSQIGKCKTPVLTPTLTLLSPTPIFTCDPLWKLHKIEDQLLPPCSPTPTPTEEVTPTPVEITPTPTPSEAPDPVESPTRPVWNESGTTMPSAPLCQDTIPYKVTDFWIENPIADDGALTLRWGPSQDWDKVNIAYGENKYEWTYALLGTEDDGEEVIRGLHNGTHYWFQIAYLNGCAVSAYSEPIDPTP